MVWTYMTLDAVDGKQARRTNTSSPLGQLFDHGVDAVVISIQTFVMSTALKLGDSQGFYNFWIGLTCLNYSQNWEEYHLKEYRYSMFGFGITDMNLSQILLLLMQAATQGQFCKWEIYGLSVNQIFGYSTGILFPLSML